MPGLTAAGRPRIGGLVNGTIGRLGWKLIRRSPPPNADLPADFDDETVAIISKFSQYTMTSPERISALVNALRYVSRSNIPGAVVECGVWRGGSMMATATTLLALADLRDLYLFDTFEGMTEPSDIDLDPAGQPAQQALDVEDRATSSVWAYAPLEDVQANMISTGYPSELVHYVKGPVEQTLPHEAPEDIALLRLDTDFYESTRHELAHLIARVSPNGVLILDDYGHWEGARRAVDEWVAELERPVLLNRIDYTGRIAVLP
jgi:O-methyltransferase